jgi:hypothetical protein
MSGAMSSFVHRILSIQATRRAQRRLPPIPDLAVTVVLVGWDPAQTQASLRKIQSWARGNGIELEQVMVVWNNAGVPAPDLRGATVVAGSNDELDLGGYAEGMRALRSAGEDPPERVWLMCNDRLADYETRYPILAALGPASIGLARTGCMIGWVWSYGPVMSWRGLAARTWVNTHGFLLGGSCELLDQFEESLSAAPAQSVRLVDGRFTADPDVDPAILTVLTNGLIVQPGGEGDWHWYRARKLEDSDVPFLEKKARSGVVERIVSLDWSRHGVVVGVAALPDVLAGYQVMAPGGPPLALARARRRLWWRLSRHRAATPPLER